MHFRRATRALVRGRVTVICSDCGREMRSGHRCVPSIDQIVQADMKLCDKVGHAGPGPVCVRCGHVDEPDLESA